MRNLILFFAIFFTSLANAQPLEFQYVSVGPDSDEYRCLNASRAEGFNQGYLGECGQISGFSFRDPQARSSMLKGTQAAHAIFFQGDFSGAYVKGADFSDAHFHQTRLEYVHVSDSNFSFAVFNSSQIDYLSAYSSNFHRLEAFMSSGNHVRLQAVDASESNFSFASLPLFSCLKCNFSGANFYRASLRDSLISYSDFTQADLGAAIFSSAIISTTKMDAAKLKLASFDSASLSAVSFAESQAVSTNFVGARIMDCDFSGADLRGANFSALTFLDKTVWRGAIYDDTTKLPFSEARALEEGMIKATDQLPARVHSRR